MELFVSQFLDAVFRRTAAIFYRAVSFSFSNSIFYLCDAFFSRLGPVEWTWNDLRPLDAGFWSATEILSWYIKLSRSPVKNPFQSSWCLISSFRTDSAMELLCTSSLSIRFSGLQPQFNQSSLLVLVFISSFPLFDAFFPLSAPVESLELEWTCLCTSSPMILFATWSILSVSTTQQPRFKQKIDLSRSRS